MSIEAMWYASYDADGNHPQCNRLIRLPRHEQLGMAFDLAIDFRRGCAGYRNVGENQTTGENYWWWPRPNVKYGDWWMLPKRTITLMQRATRYAERRAREYRDPTRRSPNLSYGNLIMVHLRRLQRRAHKAARAMAGQEAPEFTKTTRKLQKLRADITPQDGYSGDDFRQKRCAIVEEYGPRGQPQTRDQWERWV
jgi:hypothetical protein